MAGPSVPTRSWDLDVAAAAAPGFWPIVGVTPDGIDKECRRGSRSRPHRRPAKFKAVLVTLGCFHSGVPIGGFPPCSWQCGSTHVMCPGGAGCTNRSTWVSH